MILEKDLMNVKDVTEIISQSDLDKLNGVTYSCIDAKIADINVHFDVHLGNDEDHTIQVYENIENFLYYLRLATNEGIILSENDIKERTKIMYEWMDKRKEGIDEEKWLLSEYEHHDIGLLVASADWRVKKGDEFYAKANKSFRNQGYNFDLFVGSEKAIVIETKDTKEKSFKNIIYQKLDFNFEEGMIQTEEMELKGLSFQKKECMNEIMEHAAEFRKRINRVYCSDDGRYRFIELHPLIK